MLTAIFNDFRAWAKILKEEDGIDYAEKGRNVIQVMADGYCLARDNDDEHNKNKYIAGLMLRFWYKIKELKEKAASIPGLEYSDFVPLLYNEIEYACKYRRWQDPENKLNAQQCINQCISRIVPALYYDSNLQINKANVNTYSLETELDDEGRTTLMDTLVDENDVDSRKHREDNDSAISLIQTCINDKKIVEAIILDTIAFNDVQKVTKKVVHEIDSEGNEVKYTRHTSEFWPYKCVQILSNLPEDYEDYFHQHYHIVEPELKAALAAIKRANNQKLYRFLEKTLNNTREIYVAA